MQALRRLAAFGALTSLFLTAQSVGPGDQRRKPRVVAVILADVTSSLNQDESMEVADLAASAIAALPQRSQVRLYPIHKATENPQLIRAETIYDDADIRKALEQPRRIRIRKQIAELYEKINHPPQSDDARTCILDELFFAGNYFGHPEFAHDRKVLLIVSDMLEDCGSTPLGQEIHLNKLDLRKELAAAQKAPPIPGLAGVTIVAVLPPTSQSRYHRGKHPRLEDLEAFWNEIVLRAGNGSKEKPCTIDWRRGELPESLGQEATKTDCAR